MEKLLLVDGSSLLHRAFYALPLLSNRDGVYTNAVHGFMMMFNRMVAQQKPTRIAVCFDESRTTFRTELYAEYKGTRAETPQELRGQFALIKDVLAAAGVHCLELKRYEADDLLGTLAAQGAAEGMTVEIFSGDRDVFQLINGQTMAYLTRKGISEIERYDEAAVWERYGVSPAHLADLKGLMGDASDNIPGIVGIGEKTAIKLLSQYGDLETLYANLEQVPSVKLQEKLRSGKEAAFTSRMLATICKEAPIDVDWAALAYDPSADKGVLASLYSKLGLQQLLRGLGSIEEPAAAAPALQSVPVSEWEDKPWPTQEELGESMFAEPSSAPAFPAGACGLLRTENRLLIALPGEKPRALSVTDGAALAPYQEALQDVALAKYAADAKDIINLLAAEKISLFGLTDDVCIAAYLLDPARGAYLLPELLVENGFSLPNTEEAQLCLLPELAAKMREQLENEGMLALYTEMEMPLVQILAEMEQAGIRVDENKLSAMSKMLAASSEEYQRQIYGLAGHEFNLNSPKQLCVVLFEEMGIPPLKKTKTGYSTDAEVLETLALTQPIAQLLLDYRMAAKLRSTYTDGLRKLIAADGKLHTSFKQTVTATGRLSSAEPNLQNIPVRHELGRRIREVFSADRPGDLLLAADYNQIELRVLAHISGDAKLRAAYLNGEDIHTRTAAEVLGVNPDEITPVQRRAAKAVNFGIVYGISDYGLSRDLGISRKEAELYIERYFLRYPDVAAYQKQTIQEAREKGYAETLFGRRRYLPDLNNRNFNLRSFAERMAINAPIQGTAADIIKLAMVELAKAMKEQGLASRMLLQVHDELIFNVPIGELDVMKQLVKEKMEQAVQLSLPLVVDVKIGADWYHMEKVKA